MALLETLILSLLTKIGDRGDIVVYNQSFEIGVIRQLAKHLPKKANELMALLPRIRDLMGPFQKRHYYHPEMNGAYSIKSVLPALVPELGYDNLAVSDGRLAMQAFIELQAEADLDRAEAIRNDLWEYCMLDTLAMVRILEELESLCLVADPRSEHEFGGSK